jgi:phenylalanyl-tRNA synthetase beta chain
MKFTLSWLMDHLETDASLDEIVTTLSAIGLEVDGVDDPAASLGAFTIAHVVDAKQHPDADRLRVCQVEVALGQPPVEVICGAPNARTGLVGVFAPLGTYIPGTGITLEKKPVRGIVSNGMLVSERELELSDEHEGIIELDEALAGRLGERYIDVVGLNDPVIEIGLTPNRPDCTGVRGIARDLAAAGLGTLKPEPKHGNVEGDFVCPVDIGLHFSPEAADACPIFAGRYVRGVQNGSSPKWLQQRLKAIGLRPISTLVDITNYITFDRGRPLHVYDADKIAGQIHARLGKKGERFLGLDGKTYEADETTCVIADDSGVLGFGGIMGGEATGCTEETRNILIESAYFDPVRTAETGRKNGLITDARYRFERGVDPAFVEPGLDLATDIVMKLCGGEPSKARIAGKAPEGRNVIAFDFGKVAKLTGHEVPRKDIEQILEAIGCEVTGKGPAVKVSTPTWRPDMHASADLVEEVIRIVGLDAIVAQPMSRDHGVTRAVLTADQKRSRRARRTLASRGLVEAITWSFIARDDAEHFGGGSEALELDNPISSELTSMRPSLLPGLLAAVHRNKNRGFHDAGLFELGQAYRDDSPEGQMLHASGVRTGTAKLEGGGRHWSGKPQPVDVFDAKADVVAVLAMLGLNATRAQITRDAPGWYHPGRSGTLRLGPKLVLAHFGEIHPATLRRADIDGTVVGFEVFLSNLPPEKQKSRMRPPLTASDLLPIRRDFAFMLDESVAAADVVRAAQGADRTLIAEVNVFDVFSGGNLGEGRKSLAIEVTLQPTDHTLTDKEIEKVSEKIVACVTKATGGTIRG